ncbi:MAG: cytochrome c3 family protein [Elusimicrobiota bacterium]
MKNISEIYNEAALSIDLSTLPLPDTGESISILGLLFLLIILAVAIWLLRKGQPGGAGAVMLPGLLAAFWAFGGVGLNFGFAPEQPVAFSHKKHAGDLGLACWSCHREAGKGEKTGYPKLNHCLQCHDREALKVTSDEVEWIRVHRLPGYVRYSHQSHIGNNILCQECHGPVQTMDRVQKVSRMSMGWCMDCHRRDPAPAHWKKPTGTLKCAACH